MAGAAGGRWDGAESSSRLGKDHQARDEWGRKQSAQRAEARRAPEEWTTVSLPHLRIVSDALWASARARLGGSRETYLRSTKGRLAGRPPDAIETAKYLLVGRLAAPSVAVG